MTGAEPAVMAATAAAASPMLEWGLGAAVAILLLERVYVLVKMILENTNKRSGSNGHSADAFATLSQEVHDLHQWHDVTDDEGVRLWYSRRSVERAVERIAESQATQTNLLKDLARVVETQARTATEMQRTLADLYTNLSTHRGDTCPFRTSSARSKNTD